MHKCIHLHANMYEHMHAIMYKCIHYETHLMGCKGTATTKTPICRFTAPPGKTKFLRCPAECSRLQVKETRKQQVCGTTHIKQTV